MGEGSSWIIWVMLGLMAVLLIGTMIPQRRRQKKAKEKLNAIIKGDKVKTIGGFIGVVEAVNAATNSLVLNVGVGDEKVLITIDRAGIYTVIDPEAEKAAAEQAKQIAEQEKNKKEEPVIMSADDLAADEQRKKKQAEKDKKKKEKEGKTVTDTVPETDAPQTSADEVPAEKPEKSENSDVSDYKLPDNF